MIIDWRKFNYPLEPLRKKRQWQIDAILLHLARVKAEINSKENEIQRLKKDYLSRSQSIAKALLACFNPEITLHSLQWLAKLKEKILASEKIAKALHQEKNKIHAEYLKQQCRLDLLDCHRQHSMDDFTMEEGRHLAKASDLEWLTRQGHSSTDRHQP